MTCNGTCNPTTNFDARSEHSCNTSLAPETLAKTNRHPCYSFGAHHQYARMHLPVAPKCNISCNYCNRKFDCVNESRPGVTSEVLQPGAALRKYSLVKERIEALSVVGIAGPGDALANWTQTKKSIQLIQEKDPEVIFCLSTNGLLLPDYAQEIIDLGIQHVTVTLNCLDPELGAKIYRHVLYRGIKYSGVEGAQVLLTNQLAGIRYLTERGVMVKVNIVMIKGINDRDIPAVVKQAKELGVFITNIMPLIPAPGSVFEDYPQTSTKELNQMRDLCQVDLPQMRHCQQCRADAIGLLGEDRSREFAALSEVGGEVPSQPADLIEQPALNLAESLEAATEASNLTIAVASKYGKLIDQHFGYASEFSIYQAEQNTFRLVEKRQVNKYCTGVEECDSEESRRDQTISALEDCQAVLTMRIGYHAREKLTRAGIVSIESCDTVEAGLRAAQQVLLNGAIA